MGAADPPRIIKGFRAVLQYFRFPPEMVRSISYEEKSSALQRNPKEILLPVNYTMTTW